MDLKIELSSTEEYKDLSPSAEEGVDLKFNKNVTELLAGSPSAEEGVDLKITHLFCLRRGNQVSFRGGRSGFKEPQRQQKCH